jgi:hypothetical protein
MRIFLENKRRCPSLVQANNILAEVYDSDDEKDENRIEPNS